MRAARRAIARLRTTWLWLAIGAIGVDLAIGFAGGDGIPFRVLFPALLVAIGLSIVPAPPCELAPVRLAPPVRGRWLAINGPGSTVPSHGTRGTGQKFAVDVLLPTTADTPAVARAGVVPNRPDDYPTFGADIHAMADGTVLRTVDRWRDHRARNTWPMLAYLMVVEGFGRSLAGFSGIAGNHVVIRHDDGLVSLYAHLKRGSIRVAPGRRVAAGEILGEAGNSGNSSEPHLHVQLMEHASATASSGVPMLWDGITWGSERDERWAPHVKKPDDSAIEGFPPNATVFESAPDTPE